ncbi:MAG: sulfotransferase family protein [Bacteroidota bacterium]
MATTMSKKPDFFIVGAAKAGTTALQKILASLPAVYMSPIKEPNYFYNEVPITALRKGLQEKLEKENATQWIKEGMNGELWNAFIRDENVYQQLFTKATKEQICGEASVSYLYSLKAAEKIFQYNPTAKIIILLRNPVDRAWSHFHMEQRMGLVPNHFLEAFNKYKNEEHPIWGKDPIFLSGGLYYEQVKRFLSIFPKEQVFICLYDEYKNHPENTIKKIITFLGIKEDTLVNGIKITKANEARKSIIDGFLPSGKLKSTLRKWMQDLRIHHLLKKWLSKENDRKLSEENRMLLKEFYQSDIEKLESLINLNLSNWK